MIKIINKHSKLILIAVIIIAAVLRLWQLGQVPPSPDWDEVALGYDAYSIMNTGRDEFGKFLPVVLRSFDDYKPALYAYLAIPTVFIFGLNTLAVRLPSAIFGIVSTIAVFYLVRELFRESRHRDILSLLASFFFAISPWSLQFSRIGFESNVGTGLNILAALFFLKGLKNPILLSLASVFAGLSLYAYQSEKVFTPLLVLILVAVFASSLLKVSKKYLLFAAFAGFLVVLPMVFNILTDKSALLRVRGTSFFSYQTELLKTNIQRLERDQSRQDVPGLLLDNRRLVYLQTVLAGYISHFDLNWLFIRGDISRHHAPGMGLLYLFELPLVLIGVYKLLFRDYNKKSKLTIFLWFLAAAVPASITTGVPHAVRTLNFLPIYQIFTAIGMLAILIFIKGELVRKNYDLRKVGIIGALCVYVLLSVTNFAYYLNQYFVQQNYFYSQDWQYGYEQAVELAKKEGSRYKKIVVSDSNPMDKSYMFFLFYLKYPPEKYQEIGKNSSGSFVSHHSFGKYEFRPIDWSRDSKEKDTLFIGPPAEVPSGASIIKTIYNLDGKVAIRIAAT